MSRRNSLTSRLSVGIWRRDCLLLPAIVVCCFLLGVSSLGDGFAEESPWKFSVHTSPPNQRSVLGTTRLTTAPLSAAKVEVNYSAAQVEAILQQAKNVWDRYVQLQPQLATGDTREQVLVRRVTLLRAQVSAVERLLAAEKRKPTREGPQVIGEALTALDRSGAVVEHYLDRVALRIAQKALIPSDQPFCLCAAPAFERVSPEAPTTAKPATEVNLALAAGEAESFQVVVVPYWERLERVRVGVEDLFRHDSIDRFDPDQVRLWLVQAIAVSSPIGRDYLWPDPLTPARPFDLPSTASQSIVVDVRARKDQPPGLYKGLLTVETANCGSMTISLSVQVRPFALSGPSSLDLAFQPRNDFLQERLAALLSRGPVRIWEIFLANYRLRLYGQEGSESPGDRQPWLSEHRPLPTEALSADPYSPAAPTCFIYRRAAWAAWSAQHADRATARRWLANGWVSFDPPMPQQPSRTIAPLVRSRWSSERSVSPPGMIWVNDIGDPEPTLRLIALRDGIEDYYYLATLDRLIAEVKNRKAASWWKRRKWNRLLRVDPRLVRMSDLSDVSDRSQETLSGLLAQREAVARAIEEVQGYLDKAAAGKR